MRIQKLYFSKITNWVLVESDAGESLDDVLSRSKKFSNENTLRVGYCLMKGLAHLHNCGVVHMDLNDGNVTLKRKGDGVS